MREAQASQLWLEAQASQLWLETQASLHFKRTLAVGLPTQHGVLRVAQARAKKKPAARLSKSGQKWRRRAQRNVKRVIIGLGWGRAGSMNFAANCGKQGWFVTHEVACGSA